MNNENQNLPNGCSLCGCIGLHACLGEPMLPWTEEKIKEFEAMLEKYENKE